MKYIGITIGPIFSTIQLASSPAVLWFSSGFFSDITRRICTKMQDRYNATIYSPYFDSSVLDKFHDRVYAQAENFEGIDDLLNEVKADAGENFGGKFRLTDDEKEFLKQYIQISYVILDRLPEETNIIRAFSDYLDCMELINTFPEDNSHNPFIRLNINEEHNETIKSSLLFERSPDKDQLSYQVGEKRNIRQIDNIASLNNRNDSDIKYSNYYAVVSADGDAVGALLKNITSNETVAKFSSACLCFARQATQLIGDFGGMTIYAGGDDLLFISPVIGNKQKNIFELCSSINELFKSVIKEELPHEKGIDNVSVSFGVSIQFKRYPLYESFSRALSLLERAKKTKEENEKKERIAYHLQKHSGQSVRSMLGIEKVDSITKLFNIHCGNGEAKDLKSVYRHLKLFKEVLTVAEKDFVGSANSEKQKEYEKIWHNIFDNEGQNAYLSFVDRIADNYYDCFLTLSEEEKKRMHYYTDTPGLKEKECYDTFGCFLNFLKFKNFLAERSGD